MKKPFKVNFKVDAKILAILYICYKYKFPASYMLSFYEMFGEQSLFILKAMSCGKKLTLNDNTFIKIIEDSRKLHKQILAGVTTQQKIKQLTTRVKCGHTISEQIPEEPVLNLSEFSDDYSEFITDYLLANVTELFCEEMELSLNSKDLYEELC